MERRRLYGLDVSKSLKVVSGGAKGENMIKKIFRRIVFWAIVAGVVLFSISQFPNRFQDATEAYLNG